MTGRPHRLLYYLKDSAVIQCFYRKDKSNKIRKTSEAGGRRDSSMLSTSKEQGTNDHQLVALMVREAPTPDKEVIGSLLEN